ncbi:hypothetical protein EGW08_015691 [Elysia chlorotica]|uniref:Cyclin-F n=1 Tax=Elysia chlorotica TaxID=188477 RepID=A0A3S1BB93_ELYCH|nr:hypothetical protein EGW08_015691 [Elysia chlorotica]
MWDADLSILNLIAKLLRALRTISNTCSHIPFTGSKKLTQRCRWPSVTGAELSISAKRPRTRSSVTLWSLPESVLVHILGELHIRDLLAFRSVHPHFCDIIDTNTTLWKSVSFANSWPSEKNLSHFKNAAERKNVEAAVKLAVAYLYKEGICQDGCVTDVSCESAHYFCLSEILTPETFPFFWIFVRPPWSLDGECCKAKTFRQIQAFAERTNHPDLSFGVGLTLKLQRISTHGVSKVEEINSFNQAVKHKSKAAAFFLLLDIDKDMDKAKELERVRMLRLISSSVLEAKMFLIRHYVQGQYGGISCFMAQNFVRDCFQCSQPSRIHITYSNGQTTDISRYILVDWLVEVLGMKEYSTHTLYLAVSMFDRFLQVRKIERSHVQLLGVAAMVISSRYLGFNILTIREAAWLTDNSYSYQDVVRMMGELVAALGGNLRVLNIHDFVMVLAPLVGETCQSAMLMEYLAMLCLLQSEMGQYSPSEIASSCLLLARLLLDFADPWPMNVQEWTGFTQDYLSLCAFHIYNKCLLEGSEVDYRDTKLQAVKTRYADPNRFSISKIKIIRHTELCKRLGVAKLVNHGRNTKAIKFRNTDELIMSPGRGQGQDYDPLSEPFSGECEGLDRRLSATPPIDHGDAGDEPGSGYDGDQEDVSDESFLSKPDSEMDLWDSTLEDSSHDSEEDGDEEDDDAETNKNTTALNSIAEHLKKFSRDNSDQPPAKRVPCLSSMCQLGTKLSCNSAMSSSSSCVANCWCSQSVTGTFEVAAGSMSAPEMRTTDSKLSSPSLGAGPSQTSSSPSAASSMTSQNIRTCIPRGSIGKMRREKSEKGSKYCDILSKKLPESGSRKGQPLTRSKSLHSYSSCDKPRNFGNDHSSNVPSLCNSDSLQVDPFMHIEENSMVRNLNGSQKRVCNIVGEFPVSKGSDFQDIVFDVDLLSPPCGSSAFEDKSHSSSSTPSFKTSSDNISQTCDTSHPPCGVQLDHIITDNSQKALRTPGADVCAKGMMGKQIPSPATPENSLDSFTGSSQVHVMPQPLLPGGSVDVNLNGAPSKKAKLDFDICNVSAHKTKELCVNWGSIQGGSSSAASVSECSHQSSTSKCADTGPVLRRKRKGSDGNFADFTD